MNHALVSLSVRSTISSSDSDTIRVAASQREASRRTRSDEGGFTLIELLIVVAIIGVLAGIGFSSLIYARTRSYNTQAKTDLRNAVVSQESYFVGASAYITCANQAACQAALPGFVGTAGVEIAFTTDAPNHFVGTATHPRGDAAFEFDNATGTLLEVPIP
ncbi:MAG: prepilin-type N-terminal cleavage/methylation domain-containing protein [Deltaproteobacteria bacterium]|nr:prepilin-type N-terminal cleavage/methylation domain-containing protein [Deltaproteobacteria bacterium]